VGARQLPLSGCATIRGGARQARNSSAFRGVREACVRRTYAYRKVLLGRTKRIGCARREEKCLMRASAGNGRRAFHRDDVSSNTTHTSRFSLLLAHSNTCRITRHAHAQNRSRDRHSHFHDSFARGHYSHRRPHLLRFVSSSNIGGQTPGLDPRTWRLRGRSMISFR